jgi:curved DNA-binding protein CbpA
MKASRCLYSVLELEPDATDNDIKKAFRKAALIWHPDKHGDKSGAELEEVRMRDPSDFMCLLFFFFLAHVEKKR